MTNSQTCDGRTCADSFSDPTVGICDRVRQILTFVVFFFFCFGKSPVVCVT